MKDVVEQLSTYKSVHLNKNNIRTHFVGVPLIIWSVFVLISFVQLPFSLHSDYLLTLALPFTIVVLIYYFWLNLPLAVALLAFILPTAYSAHLVAQMPRRLVRCSHAPSRLSSAAAPQVHQGEEADLQVFRQHLERHGQVLLRRGRHAQGLGTRRGGDVSVA